MIRGDKTRAWNEIRAAALESIQFSYAENRPTDWTSKSWQNGFTKFVEAAGQIADAVLLNMQDLGSVPFIKGKLAAVDVNRGIDVASKAYEGIWQIESYRKKKLKLFITEFKARCLKTARQWKEQSDVYFDLSKGRTK